MALNLSDILRQLNNSYQANNQSAMSSKPGEAANNAGLVSLKNMLSGDIFSGKIMSVTDSNALLMLSDGSYINARLEDKVDVTVGNQLTFLVQENNGKSISIKALLANSQEAMLIDKALSAGNFSSSPENIRLANEMIRLNMPLDAKTLGTIIKYSTTYPETNINTIINLHRLSLPVNEDNIKQFEAYSHFENSISSSLAHIGNELSDLLTKPEYRTLPEYTELVKIVQTSVDILYSETYSTGNMSDYFNDDTIKLLNNTFNEQLSNDLGSSAAIYQEAAAATNESGAFKEAAMTEPNAASVNQEKIDVSNMPVKDVLKLMTDIALKGDSQLENVLEKLPKDFTEKLFSKAIDEALRITPENIAKEAELSKFFKRTKKIIDSLSGEAAKHTELSKLSANLKEVNSSVEFMNDLSKNMVYMQMPVRFKENNGDGNLYVFTNKKALKNNSTNVSALLHLDMDNLGPMDIYVKLNGKNVSTNFCLESEELLDFVYSHIDKLNKRLEELGYSTKFEMKVSEPDSFSFVTDFVEKDIPKHEHTQFLFDIKA